MTRSGNGRLGRGLASLIPDSALDGQGAATPSASGRSPYRVVPLDEILPNPEQPRKHFEPEALEALAASIREHGVMSPLLVRRAEGRYVLVAGERRLRASALVGLSEVPVLVRDELSPTEQLALALVENLQREDLDPAELAQGYARLMKEHGLTQEEVARQVGRDRATVANAVRLLKLPPYVLDAVRSGELSAGHARALVPLADSPAELKPLLARVLAQRLSVRATERLVAAIASTPKAVRSASKARRDNAYAYATQLLSEALHADVAIKPRSDGGGRIVIGYGDKEELERLLTRLRGEGA